jgi:hypothetical protein
MRSTANARMIIDLVSRLPLPEARRRMRPDAKIVGLQDVDGVPPECAAVRAALFAMQNGLAASASRAKVLVCETLLDD